MRKICIILIVSALSAGIAAGQDHSGRVGVAEFEVKNDIGLDNAAVVIPEVLVSKLKEVGKYELSERILMEKVLEEQKLQMTGLTDEETVVKVGEIYNIAAVVSGSAMRVGSTITISGRLIDTETAEIKEAATVKFEKIDELEKYMREMAFRLSGWSSSEYENMVMREKVSRNRYGVRLGTAYQFNSTDIDPNSIFAPLTLGLFFHSRWVDTEILGNVPVTSESSHLTLILHYNPFLHVGFGAVAGYLYDGISEVDNEKEILKAEYVSLMGGLNYRAGQVLRAGLYLGGTVTGEIRNGVKYDADGSFAVPDLLSGLMTIEYSFNDRFSLMLYYLSQAGEGPPKGQSSGDPEYMSSNYLSIAGGYSFSFDKR